MAHLPNGNPVQRHSAGSHFPYVVAVIENADTGLRQYEVTGPLLNPARFVSQALASAAANVLAWAYKNRS